MSDPSKRFVTIALALGIAVLVLGIALGERAGDKVIGQVTEKRLTSIAPITVTPQPTRTISPYGSDWKRSDVMAAASDPQFPDPRVPPVPPPTPLPPPKYSARAAASQKHESPKPSASPNLNIPIWRREAPLPTATPSGSPSPDVSESPSPSPAASTQP